MVSEASEPDLTVVNRIQAAVKCALHEQRYASPDLRDMLRGHRLRSLFRVLSSIVGAARRLLDKSPQKLIPGLWDWRLGLSASINVLLTRFGWQYVRPWLWKHRITREHVALTKRSIHWTNEATMVIHQLREGFRANCWRKWQIATRNDAQECSNIRYDANRAKLAIRQDKCNTHRFAVLAGAYCSPAALAVANGSNSLACPHSRNAVGHTAHMYWACAEMPDNSHIRLQRPADRLQARLVWPCGLNSQYDEKVLAWLAFVRMKTLERRYGHVT